MSTSYASKKDKKLNENKEMLQKQKDSLDKYNEGKYYCLGLKWMRNKPLTTEDIEKAVHLFTDAICSATSSISSQDKGAAKFHAARGDSLMKMGNYTKAAQDFTTAIRLDDMNSTYYSQKGNCYEKLDKVFNNNNEILQQKI